MPRKQHRRTISLPLATYERIRQYADAIDCSMSGIVEDALESLPTLSAYSPPEIGHKKSEG